MLGRFYISNTLQKRLYSCIDLALGLVMTLVRLYAQNLQTTYLGLVFCSAVLFETL